MGPRRKRGVAASSSTKASPPASPKPDVKKATGKSVRSIVEEKLAEKKNVKKKAMAPVDENVPAASQYEVVVTGDDVWSCLLNQTNVGNNNNKYYVIQVLKKSDGNYFVWNRWGRVGYKGQTAIFPYGSDLEGAKHAFEKKFKDKTKNEWSERGNFEHVHGKYDLLQVEMEETENEEKAVPAKKSKREPEVKEEAEEEKKPESKLPPQVQEIMNLIFDMKEMEATLTKFNFDVAKAPLGKLTHEQLRSGYLALARIDELIADAKFGTELAQACNDYYTKIPHYFGMRAPTIIRTEAAVRAELELLDCLGDIEIAMKVVREKSGAGDVHPMDSRYESLGCRMEPLDPHGEEFKMIQTYLTTNHASTHMQYQMKLKNVFKVARDVEENGFKDLGNNMLLWHGSRLTNYAGILSTGLRIAPPEAPVTGYMFGKGIYFADMSSKSANYCYTSRSRNVGLMLLSQVSLGVTDDLIHAKCDYHTKLPKNKDSVKGLGMFIPDPTTHITTKDGTLVPIGKEINSKVKDLVLNYNEYIVYDPHQVKMKYLLEVEFKYK